MGREVKRVRLDFDWPIKKVWPGYVLSICAANNEDCESCKHFTRLKGLVISPYGCPDIEMDPPEGDGYQMWETTSEGSPISPVFESAEKLARWLADTRASAFGGMTATYEQWLYVCNGGYAPSAVYSQETGLISGVESCATLAREVRKE